jgi:hypothetical protein
VLTVQWFPPSGSLPLLLDSAPLALIDVSGISSTIAAPVTQHSSSQIGTTVSGVAVDARTITITLDIVVDAVADLWIQRQLLSAAFAFLPAKVGQFPALGTLRFSRDGQPDLDILAMPQTAPDIHIITDTYGTCDLTFYCPYPFYKDTVDSTALLQGTGGLTFPVQHPFQMTSYNITSIITNSGTVPAPLLIRLYGDCTTPRLTNATTGAILEVSGHVVAGSYLEINTDYGLKSVTLVDSLGNRSNLMGNINLTLGTVPDIFPSLAVGTNVITFSAATNVSGLARLFWRQRYSGI